MGIKILLFSQYFPPEMGALATRSYEHSLRWVQMGHHVTVICGTPNYPDGKIYQGFHNRLFQRQKIDGIDVIRTWVLPKPNRSARERISNYTSYFLTAVLAGLRAGKPDVVIGSSPQLLTSLAAFIVARLKQVPFVFEVRDLWPESIAASGLTDNSVLLRVLTWLARFLYKRANRIVVVTEPFREYLIPTFGVDETKIDVVPNGVDLKRLNPGTNDGESIRREYGLEGKFIVSYIGGIGAAHGLGTVLDAAALLQEDSNVFLLLVGDGAEREKLEKASEQRKLKNVAFTGKQPKTRIPDFLQASDVALVVLRRKEIFKTVIPTKMLESMAMAKPIILGVEGEAKRIIEEAGAGVPVTPENPSELATAIRKLREDPALCVSLGEKGREYVKRLYDRDKLAADYTSILEQVASSQVCKGCTGRKR